MEFPVKYLCLVGLVMVACIAELESVSGAGECGRVPVDRVALRMAPCASASQNARAPVPARCCLEVQKLGRNPNCLCAVMLSNAAKRAGVQPAVAVTIPKRCRLARRPVGYKCGGYTLP